MRWGGTSLPSRAETRFWRMRAPVSASIWLNRTVLRLMALCSRTGMVTRPKPMDPLQIALAMTCLSLRAPRCQSRV